MPETAEAHLQHLTTNRFCVIEMKNCSSVYCCFNPQVYTKSGFCFSPPMPTLSPQKQEVFSFTKDDNTASGSVGVMTYELFNTQTRKSDGKMAIMFSVPFDYNFYENWLGVGIFGVSQTCDEKLFDEMYNGKDFTYFQRYKADGSGLVYRGEVLDVRACMSDDGKAIVKLELYDKMGR
ncbi:bryoporin-like [Cheilinus undulatus]|uniref:bryoporin-like n=1 Tax=Cheilinus undulatus TaxID=241271 RepID=UPI001BD37DB7|nr:bryoporin-like [Cheilinus undulatus]XP_041672182.1 bryoporin-like [Cheilinus undulatus]XP_041672183.1 bryoporin-like [Cheilinus undulatus]